MGEALKILVPWFIRDRKVKELVAFAEVNNRGSRRLLERLELGEYGILENARISQDLQDVYQFAVYKKRY